MTVLQVRLCHEYQYMQSEEGRINAQTVVFRLPVMSHGEIALPAFTWLSLERSRGTKQLPFAKLRLYLRGENMPSQFTWLKLKPRL